MMRWTILPGVLSATLAAGCATPPPARAEPALPVPATANPAGHAALNAFLRQRNTTGFVVVRDGQVLIEESWPAPSGDALFGNFVYGQAADGALLEDIASQQKSFVAVLVAIAADKGLIDVAAPVSTYLGEGWSRASREQESAIRVIDILTMSSGLNEQFGYVAPAGTGFFYNTPVYAVSKRIVAEAAGRPLEELTTEWLTRPAGMTETAWRQRPAALASVGNATGLVTTPTDVARFGQLILDGGVAADGTRIVSAAQIAAMFERSSTNPAYGRLWWLNGGAYTVRAGDRRVEGPLIPSAPADLVGALGAFDRRLYVVPSQRLVVVRTGAATNDPAFDEQFWRLLNAVLMTDVANR